MDGQYNRNIFRNSLDLDVVQQIVCQPNSNVSINNRKLTLELVTSSTPATNLHPPSPKSERDHLYQPFESLLIDWMLILGLVY